MAYQVLARKWRPKSFAHLKGQTHVTQALANALSRQQLHHAYLFTGTRGVGKTTLARILAKCLNCESGITATPCGECGACVAIDNGHFVDLIEVDAASRTRVEDTRDLLENVQYAPTQGRFKIYLIDEVHMLSGHSFNALLKTLEEPPAHVKFILATTDPERIPMTVLSRCLRLSLKALSASDIVTQLKEILLADEIAYEQSALLKIARAANGSMRDALSLLEQARAYCDSLIKTQAVEEMLGMHYQHFMPSLLVALSTLEVKTCLQVVASMAAIGADFEQVLISLLQIFHGLALAQFIPQGDEEIATFAEMDTQILALKDTFSPEEVQLFYQICLLGQKDLRLAPDPRTGFEMTLLRMVAFRPLSDKSSFPAQVAAIKTPATVAPSATQVIPAPAPIPVIEKVKSQNNDEAIDWDEVTSKLPLSGLSLMVVKHCVVTAWDGKQLSLTLEASQKACLNPTRQAQITQVIQEYFGRPIKVIITAGEVSSNTPIMQAQAMRDEREKEAKQALNQDEKIQAIISTFDATIEKITVL